jgi:hypothetical protein
LFVASLEGGEGLGEDKKVEISKDLKEIVATTIDSIKEGMKDRNCGVVGGIEFEIAVIKSKEAGGGFKFFIADAGGNYAKESLSKIKFQVIGLGLRWIGCFGYTSSGIAVIFGVEVEGLCLGRLSCLRVLSRLFSWHRMRQVGIR